MRSSNSSLFGAKLSAPRSYSCPDSHRTATARSRSKSIGCWCCARENWNPFGDPGCVSEQASDSGAVISDKKVLARYWILEQCALAFIGWSHKSIFEIVVEAEQPYKIFISSFVKRKLLKDNAVYH